MTEKQKYAGFLFTWAAMILAVCLISNSLEASGLILIILSPFFLMIAAFGFYIFKDDMAKCKNRCYVRCCPSRVDSNNHTALGIRTDSDVAAGSVDNLVEPHNGNDVVSVSS